MTIDIRRRGFIFGVAATAGLVVAAPKKFFILSPPKVLIPVVRPLLTPGVLPLQQLLDLQKRLDEQIIEVTAIPRWLYMPESQYNAIIEKDKANGR